MAGNALETSMMGTNDVQYGRGKNKKSWSEEQTWALIRCMQDLAIDPLWKTDGGFKNNYMNEVKMILDIQFPNFDMEVTNIDSRLKFLKNRYNAITDMCNQSGCSWNDVDKKIACELSWYEEWVKSHNHAKSLYNTPFIYYNDLEPVFGKDRATGVMAEDATTALNNMKDDDVILPVTDDSDSNVNEVPLDPILHSSTTASSNTHASNKRKNDACSQRPKKARNVSNVVNVSTAEKEFKEFNDDVRGFMKNVSGHFDIMSTWMKGNSRETMSQVLEVLETHGLSVNDKIKVARAICQDNANVDLLMSLNPTEAKAFVLTFLD